MYLTVMVASTTVSNRPSWPLDGSQPQMEFETFYERTARPLVAYLRRLTGEPEAARDLAHEAYLRLLTAKVAGLGEPQLRSYLYRTATRLVFDRWRRGERERRWRALQPPRRWETGGSPETKSDLDRVLGSLRVRDRALVWLAYVEGCNHREIARILGVRAASVRVLLHRARSRLARQLVRGGLASEVPE